MIRRRSRGDVGPGRDRGGGEGSRATYRDAFAVAEFRSLWLAQVTSVAGDQLARVALTVLVFNRTGSAGWSADERHTLLQSRQDRAHALRHIAQRAWSIPQMAGFGLGLAGAAWELVGQEDPISAAIIAAASATALATGGNTVAVADAYSYIHRIERNFAAR